MHETLKFMKLDKFKLKGKINVKTKRKWQNSSFLSWVT